MAHRCDLVQFRAALIILLIAGYQLTGGGVRAADLSPDTFAHTGPQGLFEIYGQINKGLLVYDDGVQTLAYFPVDSGKSSTRAGARYTYQGPDGSFFQGNVEFQHTPNSTRTVNQKNRTVTRDALLLRVAEVVFGHHDWGTLWMGQGRMASDQTAEVDYSGTTLAGFSGIDRIAGGQFIAFDDGTLSERRIGSTFRNLDGLGRRLRVRYDTPRFAGFSLGGSVGRTIVPRPSDQTVWDVALRYDDTIGDFHAGAAIAYSENLATGRATVDGSASVLHGPTGLSLTFASAVDIRENDRGHYVYGKFGRIMHLVDAGATAVSVDGYFGDRIRNDSSESFSVGVQAVQNLEQWHTELYLGYRMFDYDDADGRYRKGHATLTGLRVSF